MERDPRRRPRGVTARKRRRDAHLHSTCDETVQLPLHERLRGRAQPTSRRRTGRWRRPRDRRGRAATKPHPRRADNALTAAVTGSGRTRRPSPRASRRGRRGARRLESVGPRSDRATVLASSRYGRAADECRPFRSDRCALNSGTDQNRAESPHETAPAGCSRCGDTRSRRPRKRIGTRPGAAKGEIGVLTRGNAGSNPPTACNVALRAAQFRPARKGGRSR